MDSWTINIINKCLYVVFSGILLFFCFCSIYNMPDELNRNTGKMKAVKDLRMLM